MAKGHFEQLKGIKDIVMKRTDPQRLLWKMKPVKDKRLHIPMSNKPDSLFISATGNILKRIVTLNLDGECNILKPITELETPMK
jgi:hypothetical protein